jgi:hypothetical protein
MATSAILRTCSRCGGLLVGVEQGSHLGCIEEAGRCTIFPDDLPEDINEEKVIWVGWHPLRTVPSYVCLTCQPEWKEIHQLAIQLDKCWEQIVFRVDVNDTAEIAKRDRLRQDIQHQRDELLTRLLQDPYWEGSALGALLPRTVSPRFALFYERLGEQASSPTAEHALGRIRTALAEAAAELRGILREQPRSPNILAGRLYPPFDEFVAHNPDGSISARTRGHYIEIGNEGSIRIIDRIRITRPKVGAAEFEQPGGEN